MNTCALWACSVSSFTRGVLVCTCGRIPSVFIYYTRVGVSVALVYTCGRIRCPRAHVWAYPLSSCTRVGVSSAIVYSCKPCSMSSFTRNVLVSSSYSYGRILCVLVYKSRLIRCSGERVGCVFMYTKGLNLINIKGLFLMSNSPGRGVFA